MREVDIAYRSIVEEQAKEMVAEYGNPDDRGEIAAAHQRILRQRRDCYQRLVPSRLLPVCLELLAVKGRPLPNQRERSQLAVAGEDRSVQRHRRAARPSMRGSEEPDGRSRSSTCE